MKTLATLRTAFKQLEKQAGATTTINLQAVRRLQGSPTEIMTRTGMTPDPWQRELLMEPGNRILLLCSRQAGKSTGTAALASFTALAKRQQLILLLSPTQRQSAELFRKVIFFYGPWRQDIPPVRELSLSLELANGSRLIALPDSEEGIRGYSAVTMLVVDEASRVSDPLYMAVRPMLATTRGRLIALSTPFGKRGWFFEEWESSKRWKRIRVKADQIPRISPEFLAEEREAMGDRYYAQEYLTEFTDCIDQVFAMSDIEAAMRDDVQPLFVGRS